MIKVFFSQSVLIQAQWCVEVFDERRDWTFTCNSVRHLLNKHEHPGEIKVYNSATCANIS